MRCLVVVLHFWAGIAIGAVAAKPVQVFILAGQSNMEGQAVVDLAGQDYNEGKGTLVQLMRDPQRAPRFEHLKNGRGDWAVRDDVWVRYQREDAPLLHGPLGLGFSVYGDSHHFGPELEFGHVVGNHLDAQVLLIKTAWGGKSLYRDFRPPSAGGVVGKYYTLMITQVREALARLKTDFPNYDGGGCELAGLVWYHGWNDGVDPKTAVPEYEQNLIHLIQDVRREFQVPKLPVVIGELTGPWVDAPPEWTRLRQAQAAAAAHPEFAGSVTLVETREFVRRPEDSPNPSHGHHEFGNAETCFLVGEALGQGMVSLLSPPPASAHVTNRIEGWTVLVSERLRTAEPAATRRALELLRVQLREIVRVVPAPAVTQLQQVTLWFSPEYPGVSPRAEYHPGADWLRSNRRNPAMVKGVEFTDMRNFEAEARRMPNFTLHELAHAYHDRVLPRGFENPELTAAFEAARAGGRYDRVERRDANGNVRLDRAYALTNPMEYFAESTEAFFSRNDFYPFDRGELAQFDSAMERLLLKLWGLAK